MVHGKVNQTLMLASSAGERETFLDPQIARDVDNPERAIGKVDHQQRQIAKPNRLDRLQEIRRQVQFANL